MKFYIVPVIDEAGHGYEIDVYKHGLFGEKYIYSLDDEGKPSIGDCGYGLIDFGTKEFKTTQEAAKFIRKHYGEKAVIGKWRPK